MSCDEERLEPITVGDDVVRAFDFFDADDDGRIIGPSDLTDHTFRSVLRYEPGDPTAYPWTASVVGNTLTLTMLRAVSVNLPVGDLYGDLEETVGGFERIIKRWRVEVEPRVTV